jgi:quercetin dioxygenase-like cupin family protein
MSNLYTYVADLREEAPVPENGILSRTLHNDDAVKVVVFGFATGQELSAHTAPMPALLQCLSGQMEVRLAGDTMTIKPGSMIHMTPKLEHALKALEPSQIVLYLLKQPRP